MTRHKSDGNSSAPMVNIPTQNMIPSYWNYFFIVEIVKRDNIILQAVPGIRGKIIH
jgi:hypothetical protein